MGDDVLLQVRGDQFVTRGGSPVKIHAVGMGGWLNMENFIVGFPATEGLNRRALQEVLGRDLADYFFDRFVEVFFTEADSAAIADIGFNLVRIPFHYRHFEDDGAPFELKEAAFATLERAVEANARHGLYTILDLHVLPGRQNNEWHCDNPTHHAGFWGQPHFYDRVINIWRAIAERFKGNPWVAGYEPMNEPGDPTGEHVRAFFPRLNRAIREVDPDHILFLKGNAYGAEFDYYTEPLDNVAFLSMDYAVAGAAAGGEYPGETKGVRYDLAALEQRFFELNEQAIRTKTPIWVAEFGPVYSGDDAVDENRYRVLTDQLATYGKHGANWGIWTWKDVNVQGVVYLDPASDYMTRTQAVRDKKARLATDAWGHVDDDIRDVLDPIEARFQREFPDAPNGGWLINRLVRHILFSEPMVGEWAEAFRGLDRDGVDRVARSFELASCVRRERLIEIVQAAIAADRPAAGAPAGATASAGSATT